MSDPQAGGHPDRFEVRVTAESHFAWLRTRLALERTMMAWARTAVSLIGFGFAIVQFLDTVQELPGARPVRFPLRVWSMKRRPFSIVNSKSCMSRISCSSVLQISWSWTYTSGNTCWSSSTGRGVRTPATTSSSWAFTRNSP